MFTRRVRGAAVRTAIVSAAPIARSILVPYVPRESILVSSYNGPQRSPALLSAHSAGSRPGARRVRVTATGSPAPRRSLARAGRKRTRNSISVRRRSERSSLSAPRPSRRSWPRAFVAPLKEISIRPEDASKCAVCVARTSAGAVFAADSDRKH